MASFAAIGEKNFTRKNSFRTRTIHTTDKAQATASLEAVALAIKEVVLRQMIESANTVVLADTTIIPIIEKNFSIRGGGGAVWADVTIVTLSEFGRTISSIHPTAAAPTTRGGGTI